MEIELLTAEDARKLIADSKESAYEREMRLLMKAIRIQADKGNRMVVFNTYDVDDDVKDKVITKLIELGYKVKDNAVHCERQFVRW